MIGLLRVTIPEPDEGRCSLQCPMAVCNEDAGVVLACDIGVSVASAHDSCVPGPSCPGPGEYVLVPAQRWEAAMAALKAIVTIAPLARFAQKDAEGRTE